MPRSLCMVAQWSPVWKTANPTIQRPAWSSERLAMVGTFSEFEQRFDVIVIQSWTKAEIYWLHPEALPVGLRVGSHKTDPEDIVECLTEGHTAGAALLFEPLEHIVIERDCSSDAHDVPFYLQHEPASAHRAAGTRGRDDTREGSYRHQRRPLLCLGAP